jgi:hypothetical protein
MAKYYVSGSTAAALANGNAIASVIPAAAVGFKIVRCIFGMLNAGGTPTDFNIGIGVNRATARGTSSGTATVNKADPDSGASVITGVDNAWSVQPTLAAADAITVAYNTRGGADTPFTIGDLVSTVGTANCIVFVQRSGAALPASHSITYTIEWEE